MKRTLFAAVAVVVSMNTWAGDYIVLSPSSKLQSCGPDAPSGCQQVHLYGDPKTSPSEHVYHMPAGYVFVKHWHIENESIVVTRGTIKLSAEGQGEQTIKVGDYVHIPAKLVHWGECVTECEFFVSSDGPVTFNVVEK